MAENVTAATDIDMAWRVRVAAALPPTDLAMGPYRWSDEPDPAHGALVRGRSLRGAAATLAGRLLEPAPQATG